MIITETDIKNAISKATYRIACLVNDAIIFEKRCDFESQRDVEEKIMIIESYIFSLKNGVFNNDELVSIYQKLWEIAELSEIDTAVNCEECQSESVFTGSGVSDHNLLQNRGQIPHTQIDAHILGGINSHSDVEYLVPLASIPNKSLLVFNSSTNKFSNALIDSLISFQNGLSKEGDSIFFGGTLTRNTELLSSGYNLRFSNVGLFDVVSSRTNILSNAGSDALNAVKLESLTGSIILDSGVSSPVNRATLSIGQNSVFSDLRSIKKGIEYADNYALSFTQRSLVDKQYVDSLVASSSSVGAGSGLTLLGENINLGGDITQDTVISGQSINNFEMKEFNNLNILSSTLFLSSQDGQRSITISDATIPSSSLNIKFSNFISMVGGSNGLVVTDNRTTKRGIEYAGNYSLTYGPRSLVDKEYADSILNRLVFGSGFSRDGNNIRVGGTLTQSAEFFIPTGGPSFLIQSPTYVANYNSNNIQISTTAPSGNQSFITVNSGQIEFLSSNAFIDSLIISSSDGVSFATTNPTSRGIQYRSDLSNSFLTRSIIDRGAGAKYFQGNTSVVVSSGGTVPFIQSGLDLFSSANTILINNTSNELFPINSDFRGYIRFKKVSNNAFTATINAGLGRTFEDGLTSKVISTYNDFKVYFVTETTVYDFTGNVSSGGGYTPGGFNRIIYSNGAGALDDSPLFLLNDTHRYISMLDASDSDLGSVTFSNSFGLYSFGGRMRQKDAQGFIGEVATSGYEIHLTNIQAATSIETGPDVEIYNATLDPGLYMIIANVYTRTVNADSGTINIEARVADPQTTRTTGISGGALALTSAASRSSVNVFDVAGTISYRISTTVARGVGTGFCDAKIKIIKL